MKKITALCILGMTVMITACSPSRIRNEESMDVPEGMVFSTEKGETMTLPPTSKYTIPENAETGENGGPGAMATTAVDYSYYPEDKRPVEGRNDDSTLIIIYRQTDLGLAQDFDTVDTCDADSLIESMGENGAFKEGTKVVSFTVEDGIGHLELDKLDIYSARNMDVVLAGIANTFIDNLGLDSVTIKVGDTDYGSFEFNNEYND